MINWEINFGKEKKIKEDFIDIIIKESFKILNIKKAEISIAVVTPKQIKKANNIYRNKDAVTDVLSFVYNKKPLEGEVLICYERLIEQAIEKKHSFEEEFKILLVHSLVHLAGYDHEKNDEAKKMQAIESKIIKNIKFV